MKKLRRKLSLSKETLTPLNGKSLNQVAGGDGWSDGSVCPTTTPSDCKRCPIPPGTAATGRW